MFIVSMETVVSAFVYFHVLLMEECLVNDFSVFLPSTIFFLLAYVPRFDNKKIYCLTHYFLIT